MNVAPADELRRELVPGETLRWTGQPRQGMRFRATDIIMIPFSLLWAGFILFWEWNAVYSAADWIFVLWGIPFILVGLYITVGRFFADRSIRARTYYGLTERRALIVSGLFARQVKSLDLRSLPEIGLTERRDGSGTISFGASNPLAAIWDGVPWPGAGKLQAPSFDLIDNARHVYEQVRHAQEAVRAGV